jgi:mRNA-degrading endonuclease toxin of MazEF toxin-antitoxin module
VSIYDTYRERLRDWYPKQGEVYSCQLDKVRPAIIVSPDAQNRSRRNVIVVPLTSKDNDFGRSFALSAVDCGLRTRSWAKLDSAQEIEHEAIHDNPIGMLAGARLAELLSHLPQIAPSGQAPRITGGKTAKKHSAKADTLKRLGWS